jgi:starch phosphorylase
MRQTLAELVMDLRWTWSHRGDRLWQALDPEAWERTRNPYLILLSVSGERLAALEADERFQGELQHQRAESEDYRTRQSWWAARGETLRGIAYFSMEFGLTEALPLYAGGLGVLAGDYLKAASDLGVPVVGVGLLFAQGYFRQRLDATGGQQELYAYNDPATLPVTPARRADGAWLSVEIRLPGRDVLLRVWKAQVGRVPLYLLDSNDPRNSAADRGITNMLYGGDQEQRLLQEIALGIGGWRLLEALQLPIELCHLNEGHAALAAVARARSFQARNGLSFAEALWATRPGNIFTTHTPVPAGFDVFPRELVLKYGQRYASDAGVDEGEAMALGYEGNGFHDRFNMAFLAARCCATVNGVSLRHGAVSRQIFAPLYPRWPLAQVPIGHVTNGVHTPSWDSAAADALWSDCCGHDRWLGRTETHEERIAQLGDEALWSLRGGERADLVGYARRRLRLQFGQRGLSEELIAGAGEVLDPNVLTIGFARRFAEYKRNNLLLSDPQRLMRILLDPHRPVQLIIAGKAHPADQASQHAIRDWVTFALQPQLRKRVVFLEDYDLELAEHMVQGVDLWVNTPRAPWEACGTSGMKVLVNGGLNLSVTDGWWAEAYAPEVGWAVDGGSDSADAERLFEILEREVVPLFYDRDEHGIPRGWTARVRASMSRLTPQFSTNRMLGEYVERLYLPAARALAPRQTDGARLARELCAWDQRLRRHWDGVHLGSLKLAAQASAWHFTLDVYLGELDPDSVEVQLYADPAPDRPEALCQPMQRTQAIPGTAHGYMYALELAPQGRSEDFTPRVVPRHAAALLPQELPLIRWP